MDTNLSKLQKVVEDSRAWQSTVHGITKNQIWLSDWTTTTTKAHWSITWGIGCCEGVGVQILGISKGNGKPLQHSCLENPMDGGAWKAAVHGVAEGRTRLSDFTFTFHFHFHFSLSCIGEGNGNPLQCSCLENPRDGEAWWAAVYGVTQSRTRLKWLSSSSSERRAFHV